jgi:salicylate hydroxylase
LTATVYEQAPALTEVGAGLVMAPNAVRLLRRLGVMERLLRRAVPLDWGWEFRRWEDGSVLSVEKLSGVCERLYGERTYVGPICSTRSEKPCPASGFGWARGARRSRRAGR